MLGILSFATIMGLDGIMISELRKINTVRFHLQLASYKQNTENRSHRYREQNDGCLGVGGRVERGSQNG